MKVLIAGGAGFLGSHLAQHLLDRGDEVVCIDDFSSGRRENLDEIWSHPGFTFLFRDVRKRITVPGGFDAVCNLASPASPPDYLRAPIFTLTTGAIGTQRLLELAAKNHARFVMASTSEVYGDPQIHPQTETYWGNVNPIGPRSVYDEAKRYAESLVTAFATQESVNTGIVRIFNTYGPRMRLNDGRVVSSFIDQALHGRPLTVFGDGSQTRSLCYVDDLIRGIVAMIDSDDPGPINLGNPYEQTVLEIANLVLELTGSDSTIEFRPLPIDDPKRRQPDITRARTRLGWEPQVGVMKGLTYTVQWQKQHATSSPAGLGRETEIGRR